MRPLRILLAVFAVAGAAPALAHEGGAHLKGTIQRLDEHHLALKTPDGHVTEVTITAATRFLRGDAAVGPHDVHAGERAVVHAAARKDQLEATVVKLAPAR